MNRVLNNWGWVNEAPTMTDLLFNTTRACLDSKIPDNVLPLESHFYYVMLRAHSCKYDFNLTDHLWLTKTRWTRLLRDYVDRDSLYIFIDNIREIIQGNTRKGATTNMLFKDPVRQKKGRIHRWGGCMLGMTFQGDLHKVGPPTISLFSRTSYMGYIGFVDAIIPHLIIKTAIQPLPGITLKDVEFRWHIASQQLHFFKSLPFIHGQKDLLTFLRKTLHRPGLAKKRSITWYHIWRWYKRIVDDYRDYGVEGTLTHTKYGPFRRIKKRWLQFEGMYSTPLPEGVDIKELDFSPLEQKNEKEG